MIDCRPSEEQNQKDKDVRGASRSVRDIVVKGYGRTLESCFIGKRDTAGIRLVTMLVESRYQR